MIKINRHSRLTGLIVLSWLLCACGTWGDEDNFGDVFRKGDQAFQAGDYQKAIEYYEQAVKINPDSAPAYNALGLAHHAQKDKLTNVVWFFHVALDIDPLYTDAESNLCRVYYEHGLFEEAEQSCLKALALDPNYGPVQLSLAWVYLIGKKMPDKAIVYFDEALKKTRSPVVYFGRGIAYGEIGESGKVIETITLLREMGSEEFASQLENSLRTSTMPSTNPETLTMPERQTGTLVPSGQDVVEPPSQEEKSQDVSGAMRIRLRGKLGPAPGEK